MSVINIAIFASGAGTNALNIINHFRKNPVVRIALIVGNIPTAGVVKIAATEDIPFLLIERKRFNEHGYVQEIGHYDIRLIVLAGFLWKVPLILIQRYPNRIINIHPALLPAYGGRGMYGAKVHEAVIHAKEPETGITIHYVDELYDHGAIIFQARCKVEASDIPESLARKIHALEYKHYPGVIEDLVSKGLLD